MIVMDFIDFPDRMIRQGCNVTKLFNTYGSFAYRLSEIGRRYLMCKDLNINKEIFICKDDYIILFDGGIKYKSVLDSLSHNSTAKRLIFYYWNPVSKSISPDKIPERFEKWSYSPTDCKRYGLNYNTTFYFRDQLPESDTVPKTDVYFIGKDKGRGDAIKAFQAMFEDQGLSTDFVITATRPMIQRIGYSKEISYRESLERLLKNKCILDYYADPTAGLSLRAMEHIFMQRKLITNNITISQYEFYNPQNIFILGKDDQRALPEFVRTPYVQQSLEVLEKYDFKSWLERFGVRAC